MRIHCIRKQKNTTIKATLALENIQFAYPFDMIPQSGEMCKKYTEGCEVRTRADNRPTDLKSAALDHSANPP